MRLLLIGAWIALLGAGLLFVTTRTARRATASAAWPATDGVVVRSRVVREPHRGRWQTDYEADVRYRYAVDGRTYERGTLAIGRSNDYRDPAAAQGEVGQYPVGRTVRVYYAPSDPGLSCLVPGLPLRGAGLWSALWSALLLAGLGLVAAGARSIRRRGGIAGLVDRAMLGGPS